MIDPVHWIVKMHPDVLNDYSGFYFIFKSLFVDLYTQILQYKWLLYIVEFGLLHSNFEAISI